MSSQIIVLDANIAVKMMHDELDSDQAKAFFSACVNDKAKLLVPDHFLYELINVCHRIGIEAEIVLNFFEALKSSVLTVVTPNKPTWLLAERIANDGHPKSGFPSIYDSIYHAVALDADAEFVTADKRHHAKASKWGNITLLKDFAI